ncbi:MAG: histidinol-phosphate transaminase [Vicinamibacterales bacterium]
MTHEYEKVATPATGLRLHLNENTSGCSRAVIEAIRSLTCEDAAYYADQSAAIAACARHLQLDQRHLVLTNGLDEGILAASVLSLRGGGVENPFEAIVVVPAFDMYAACADAMGARVVEIPHGDNFAFPLGAVLAAINDRTRIIFLTNPNNPTGIVIPRDCILKIAAAAGHATVFVDEAYADFSGTSLIPGCAFESAENILVGRTFAKSYGLAGLRVGALVGSTAKIDALRRVIPPYSINAAAAVALPAALADTSHCEAYLAQSRESKALLYGMLERLDVQYWPSATNFVLVRFGEHSRRIVDGLRARGIHVRDRSADPACPGCVRITTGVVEHTRRCIAGIEEVLCDAQ